MTVVTSTHQSAAPQAGASPRRLRVRRVVVHGAAAAVGGAAAASLYAVAIRAAGVPMKAGFLGASSAQPLKIAGFATGVVVCTFWGTLLAALLVRWAANPARSFLRAATTLAAASLAVPLGAGHTVAATKVALIGAHLLVAVIVIPVLARGLRAAAR